MRIGFCRLISVHDGRRLHILSVRRCIPKLANRYGTDFPVFHEEFFLLQIIRHHINIRHRNHRGILRILHIQRIFPYIGRGQRNIIWVDRQSPVDISLFSDLFVELFQYILGIIVDQAIGIAVPSLIQGNKYPAGAIDTFNRIIKYAESSDIFLDICSDACIFHIVPVFSCIDFIPDNPVCNDPPAICPSGIPLCQKRSYRCQIFHPFFIRSVKCIVGSRPYARTGLRVNQLRIGRNHIIQQNHRNFNFFFRKSLEYQVIFRNHFPVKRIPLPIINIFHRRVFLVVRLSQYP